MTLSGTPGFLRAAGSGLPRKSNGRTIQAVKRSPSDEPMSWARFGPDSDVDVFEDVGGSICCSGCRLRAATTTFTEAAPLKAHLDEHIANGHKVPATVWVDFDQFAHDRVAARALATSGTAPRP